MSRVQNILVRFDWTLLLAVFTLTSIGLIVMYGIGASRADAGFFIMQKQMIAIAIGLIAVCGFVLFDYRQLRGLALPIYAFGAAILLGVLPFGSTIRGTRGWYSFGVFSFQPVEIAKLCLVLFLASYLARFVHGRLPLRAFFGSFLATLGYVALVSLQPDFGSAMVLLAIWGLIVLFIGLPWKVLFGLIGVAGIFGVLLWMVALQPFQKDRIIAFLDPARDPRGAGYNVIQAGIAIGSGGVFGKGVSEGSQSRLRFLPEASTDFTFAVIGEELGFVGILCVFGMFGLLFYRLFALSRISEDDFATIALYGIGCIFLIHIVINAGMNLGVMPVTGIPLPFISGASSCMIAVFFAIGFAESVSVHRRGGR